MVREEPGQDEVSRSIFSADNEVFRKLKTSTLGTSSSLSLIHPIYLSGISGP